MVNKLRRALEIAAFLHTQRIRGFDPPGDEPFMDQESIDRFRQELARASGYLEFGSGGSTVLADQSGVPGVSVESDRFYARAVATRLTGKIEQICVPAGITKEWGMPLFPSAIKGRRYTDAGFGRSEFPDFILVDGRWRRACALRSAHEAHKRGKQATLMIDDYLHRPGYRRVEVLLGEPEMVGRSAIFRIGSRSIPSAAIDEALDDPF